MAEPQTLGFRQFATWLGCKPSYVTALRKDGRLVLTDDGKRVRVSETIARLRGTASPDKAGVSQRHAHARGGALAMSTAMNEHDDHLDQANTAPSATGDDEGGSRYQRARAVREQYLAAQAKLDYEERIGKLVAAAEVVQVAADIGATVRRRLETLPDILSAQVDERERTRVHTLATDHVELVLTDIARAFAKVTTHKETA